MRYWLSLWKGNDVQLQPTLAQSSKLAVVAGHSQRLAALAAFALGVLDMLEQSQPLSPAELATADGLLKSAQVAEGQTEVAVVPEIAGLLHGTLAPEPTTYPLF